MRTFHSSLNYRFPEIAEAIDLHLFKSLNDFSIQARSRSVLGDLQEAEWLQQWIPARSFGWAQAQSRCSMTVTFTLACKTASK